MENSTGDWPEDFDPFGRDRKAVIAAVARRYSHQLGSGDIEDCVDGCLARMLEKAQEEPARYVEFSRARMRGYWVNGASNRCKDLLRRYRGAAPLELAVDDKLGATFDVDGQLDVEDAFGAAGVGLLRRAFAGRGLSGDDVARIEGFLTGGHAWLAAVLPPLPGSDEAGWVRVVLLDRGVTDPVDLEVAAWSLLGYPHEAAAVRTGRTIAAMRKRLQRLRQVAPWVDDLKATFKHLRNRFE